MDLRELVDNAVAIQVIVEGTSWALDDYIAKVMASRNWDLVARLLVSASELSARKLAQALLAEEAYEALAIAACLRRQPRRPGEGAAGGGAGVASRIFRDIDADNDAKGIPDFIRADIEEMSKSASQTRVSAMAREAEVDRDAIRQYIIDQLAPKMSRSEPAMDAMVAIARASAWEETRRTAALKIANDSIVVGRLARALRTEDIKEIARIALLAAVSETFAKEMGKCFQAFVDKKDAEALRFIAEHHQDPQYKTSAQGWADALEGKQAPQ